MKISVEIWYYSHAIHVHRNHLPRKAWWWRQNIFKSNVGSLLVPSKLIECERPLLLSHPNARIQKLESYLESIDVPNISKSSWNYGTAPNSKLFITCRNEIFQVTEVGVIVSVHLIKSRSRTPGPRHLFRFL